MSDTQRSVVDEDLRADLEEELEWDPAVPATHVGVSVTDHTVTVSGTVHSLTDRMATLKAIRRVAGVRAIVDELAVEPPGGGDDLSDQAVSNRINKVLDALASVPATVAATVRDGVVTLEGAVEWEYQKHSAERAVQDVRGVVRAQNDITVKPKATDQVVRSRIVGAFYRNANLDANDIHVVTEGDTVWLSGRVHSWDARQQAETAAWSSPGVSVVHNDIVIR